MSGVHDNVQTYVLSIYLEQNDAWKQATFKKFGGNFLI